MADSKDHKHVPGNLPQQVQGKAAASKYDEMLKKSEVFKTSSVNFFNTLRDPKTSILTLAQSHNMCVTVRTEVDKHANAVLNERAMELVLVAPLGVASKDPLIQKALSILNFVAVHQAALTALWLHHMGIQDSASKAAQVVVVGG